MKRAPIVIASTVSGLAVVLGVQHVTGGSSKGPLTATSSSTGTTAGSGTLAAGSAATTTTDSTAAADAAATPQATSPKAARKPAAASPKSATGSDVSIDENGRIYGDVQVKVTTRGGRITAVDIAQLNTNDGRSSQIEDYSLPQLVQQTIAAQGSRIDGVSGATYTSIAYQSSLQSALDTLGLT